MWMHTAWLINTQSQDVWCCEILLYGFPVGEYTASLICMTESTLYSLLLITIHALISNFSIYTKQSVLAPALKLIFVSCGCTVCMELSAVSGISVYTGEKKVCASGCLWNWKWIGKRCDCLFPFSEGRVFTFFFALFKVQTNTDCIPTWWWTTTVCLDQSSMTLTVLQFSLASASCRSLMWYV